MSLTLPTPRPCAPRHAPDPGFAWPTAGHAPIAPTPLILLVEDESLIRRSVAMMLSRQGFRVVSCAGAADACAALHGEATGAALVIADVHLADGPVTPLLRAVARRSPRPPLLLMSGDMVDRVSLGGHTGENLRDVVSVGLSKPFPPEELLAAVAALVPLPIPEA